MGASSSVSRRDFLRNAGLAAAGAAVGASALSLAGCAEQGNTPEQDSWDKEADVVVVGFGGAGACAAIAAADAGASVILLEKNAEAEHLSNTLMSGGIFHSPDKDGDKEALKQYLRGMFSGENLPTKNEGEQSPLFVEGIVEKFAEYEPLNVEFMQSLDPDFKVIERGGAAFPDFPGAEHRAIRATTARTESRPPVPSSPPSTCRKKTLPQALHSSTA